MKTRLIHGQRLGNVHRFDVLVLTVCAVVASLGALAEIGGDTPAPPAAPEETAPGPDLSSPVATMTTFLHGVNKWKEGGLGDALAALDLSFINPEVREQKGWELAVKLKRILDRHEYVKLDEIEPDKRYVALDDPAGRIVIDLVHDPEEDRDVWKFTAESLERLDTLYDVYRDKPLAPGIEEDKTPTLTSLVLRDWVGIHFPFLLRKPLLLENWQWLGLFTIIVVGMAVSRFVTLSLALLVRRLFAREALALDRRLERDFVRPIRVALMAWVWLLGLTTLGLPAQVLLYLRVAAKTITVVAGVWAVYRLVDILGNFLSEKAARTETKFDDLLMPLFTRSLKVFVVVFGVVFAAENLNLDYKSLLAGLGLGGLAFALAAKDTVSNIFGSLTVLIDRPFQIGDWVQIGNVDGSVETVGIRSTRIRTFYNSLVSIPNSELITATIDNMGARRYRRIKAMLAVTYDTPPEKIEAFCEGIRQLIREHPYTRKDYYHVYLNEFADACLGILLYCFHEAPDWATELRERHRLFLDIIRLAHGLGVEFAFPTQTLYVRQEAANGSVGKLTPRTADEAVVIGRAEARRILRETLGEDAQKPPPVSFEPPRNT